MKNVQFEKMKGHIEAIKKMHISQLTAELKHLEESAKDSQRMSEKHGHIGMRTDQLKRTVDKIGELNELIYHADTLLESALMIETNFKKIYWYAYKLRGMSIGCQPKGHVAHEEGYGKHGAVAYDRELTQEEIEEYELSYIGEDAVKNNG